MTAMGYRLHAFIRRQFLTVNAFESDDFVRESGICEVQEEEEQALPSRPGLNEGDAFWILQGTDVPQPLFLGDFKWPSGEKLIRQQRQQTAAAEGL